MEVYGRFIWLTWFGYGLDSILLWLICLVPYMINIWWNPICVVMGIVVFLVMPLLNSILFWRRHSDYYRRLLIYVGINRV